MASGSYAAARDTAGVAVSCLMVMVRDLSCHPLYPTSGLAPARRYMSRVGNRWLLARFGHGADVAWRCPDGYARNASYICIGKDAGYQPIKHRSVSIFCLITAIDGALTSGNYFRLIAVFLSFLLIPAPDARLSDIAAIHPFPSIFNGLYVDSREIKLRKPNLKSLQMRILNLIRLVTFFVTRAEKANSPVCSSGHAGLSRAWLLFLLTCSWSHPSTQHSVTGRVTPDFAVVCTPAIPI